MEPSIEIHETDRVHTVGIRFDGINVVAHSICHEDDKFDPHVGRDLATGRAFKKLGSQLNRRANKIVNERK